MTHDYEKARRYSGIGYGGAAICAHASATTAAGPWRTDVENAPKDGSEFVIWYDDQNVGWLLRIVHWYEPFKNFRDRMDYGVYMPSMAAFATINPPDIIT
jgi:hypothetical protein